MAKRTKEDFTYNIEEFIAPLKETDKNDWVKGVARIKWGDNPTTLDIRNINLATNGAYRGISLSDEEADALTNILLDEGYIFGDEGIGFERINIASPKSVIEECMNRIYEGFKEVPIKNKNIEVLV